MKTIARTPGNPFNQGLDGTLHMPWPDMAKGRSVSNADLLIPLMIVVLVLITIAMQSYLVSAPSPGLKMPPTNLPIYTEIPFAHIGLR
ncbi:MAG: hypothetical protein KGS72_10275 [Cyanobacteria bacterium REEB67]|nr:hypothetical protein [Cyanobacteria bacterium REEB67]